MNCSECGEKNVKIIFGRIYLCPKCDYAPTYSFSTSCPKKASWRGSLNFWEESLNFWEESEFSYAYADTYWDRRSQERITTTIPGNGQTRTLDARTAGGKRILIEWGDIQVGYNQRDYNIQHVQTIFQRALERLLTEYLVENDRIQVNLDFEQLKRALARENIRFKENDNNGRAMLRTTKSNVRQEIYIQISNLQVSIE